MKFDSTTIPVNQRNYYLQRLISTNDVKTIKKIVCLYFYIIYFIFISYTYIYIYSVINLVGIYVKNEKKYGKKSSS